MSSRVRSQARRLLAMALIALPVAALEVPFLTGRVNDRAGLMDAASRQSLETKLAGIEEETGAQIAVLTIESLEGETLEEYSLRVAETWQLGRAGEDDGVLILVAQRERRMRIEIGYGLEGQLTDLEASRILDRLMAPRFKQGDFAGGIEAAIDAVADRIRGVEVASLSDDDIGAADDVPLRHRLIGLAIFAVNVGLFSLVAIFSSGCGSWFLYFFLMPFYFLFPQALIGRQFGLGLFALWVAGFPLLKWILHATGAGKAFLDAHPGFKKAFNNSGSRSWSSGGGGGFSSGGFSGGGGSFGGGGASGSW